MLVDNGQSIVDFLYFGEANIFQEHLDSFLNIAEELQLKGLNGAEGGGGEEGIGANHPEQTYQTKVPRNDTQRNNDTIQTQSQSYYEDQITSSMAVALPKDMHELDGKIDTMMGRSENVVRHGTKQMIKAYVCQVCGKEGVRNNIRNHIEWNHLAGISIPCSLCEKTYRSRVALRKHKSICHANSI